MSGLKSRHVLRNAATTAGLSLRLYLTDQVIEEVAATMLEVAKM
jgi:hypothetical protein